MRKVTAIPEKKQLVAQGGALISDLDRAAAEYHLATGPNLLISSLIFSQWNGQRHWHWWTYAWRGKGISVRRIWVSHIGA